MIKRYDEPPPPRHVLFIWLKLACCLLSHLYHFKKTKTCTLFLSNFTINLLAFYHECGSLIGYATHYSVIDSEQQSCVRQRPLGVAEVSVKGGGQNTDPQSMDYPNGLPKWTTPKNTISDYILTLHDLRGLQPPF